MCCRCDEESAQISESVVAVERELENQQQICQTLQSELEDLEMEITHCQLNKTQVVCHNSIAYMCVHNQSQTSSFFIHSQCFDACL